MVGSTWSAALLLLVAAGVILVAAPRMVRVADRLADITGIGEALVGAVFVGAATSLPDLLATVTPAARGLPELAVGNALGGILAQTAFLAVADLAYPRANLEHAAASLTNIVQATVLVLLLGIVLILLELPVVVVLGVHAGTVALVVAYGFGLRVAAEVSESATWRAVQTPETRADEPDEEEDPGAASGLWVQFVILAVALGAAGWTLGRSGEVIAETTGLSETAVGALLTGLSSSLAELVVAIAAVRAGALTLAVANVVGGNTFDALLIGAADVAYRDGSVYGAVGSDAALLTATALTMTALLVVGLVRRQRHGVANIGTESAAMLAMYAAAVLVVL